MNQKAVRPTSRPQRAAAPTSTGRSRRKSCCKAGTPRGLAAFISQTQANILRLISRGSLSGRHPHRSPLSWAWHSSHWRSVHRLRTLRHTTRRHSHRALGPLLIHALILWIWTSPITSASSAHWLSILACHSRSSSSVIPSILH